MHKLLATSEAFKHRNRILFNLWAVIFCLNIIIWYVVKHIPPDALTEYSRYAITLGIPIHTLSFIGFILTLGILVNHALQHSGLGPKTSILESIALGRLKMPMVILAISFCEVAFLLANLEMILRGGSAYQDPNIVEIVIPMWCISLMVLVCPPPEIPTPQHISEFDANIDKRKSLTRISVVCIFILVMLYFFTRLYPYLMAKILMINISDTPQSDILIFMISLLLFITGLGSSMLKPPRVYEHFVSNDHDYPIYVRSYLSIMIIAFSFIPSMWFFYKSGSVHLMNFFLPVSIAGILFVRLSTRWKEHIHD